MSSTGMKPQCVAPRSKTNTGERCPHPAKPGSEWCGLHGKTGLRFGGTGGGAPGEVELVPLAAPAPMVLETPSPETPSPETPSPETPSPENLAAARIYRAWCRWIARRAGPLHRFPEETNNPYDFFSSDPVAEIPLRYFVSYVDSDRKGYIMDSRSVASLMEHSAKGSEGLCNPFNRTPFPPHFLRRFARHGKTAKQETLHTANLTPEQVYQLEVTDTFRHFEDLGYYTDPTWFLSLDRIGLQRLYLELADIWYHRAMLSNTDRLRIVPATCGAALPIPVRTVLIMSLKALKHTVLRSCRALVASAAARPDRQLGVMYVLGALSLVSAGAGFAYPWLIEMFAPGVTRLITNLETGEVIIRVNHPQVMGY